MGKRKASKKKLREMIFTRNFWTGVGLGLSLDLGLYLLGVAVAFCGLGSCGPSGLCGDIGGWIIGLSGLLQWAYVIPLFRRFRKKGWDAMAWGLLATACCWSIGNLAVFIFGICG